MLYKSKAIFILLCELMIISLWYTACNTKPFVVVRKVTAEQYQAEPYYITTEDYEQIKKNLWDTSFLGKHLVIMELTQPVEQMNTLRGNKAVSFTVKTMPKDLQQLLQKYNMKTGENFYNYVIDYTDRFILCPVLEMSSCPILGEAFTKSNMRLLYPAENITFLYMGRVWDEYWPDWGIAKVMVHEAAHHKLNLLIREEKVSREYYRYELTERYARIEEVKFLNALLQDTFKLARSYYEIENYIRQIEKIIEDFNSQLSLPAVDRTLLPLGEITE